MNHLKGIFSGSIDGDIYLWDLASRQTVCQFPRHQGAVRGLAASTDGRLLISCGSDCIVRLWTVPPANLFGSDGWFDDSPKPLASYVWKHAFWAVDHQWDSELFATVGAQVDIWDHNRSQPVNSFEWERTLLFPFDSIQQSRMFWASSATDCSIPLYDLRMSSPARKFIMKTKTNALSWNPREPMDFTVANEDCNCYSYDSRKLSEAECGHQDHVSAVMDIDYSPIGQEFVTGSYDNSGHSREIYHTERMQRVFCVKFSCDVFYVIFGNDDIHL